MSDAIPDSSSIILSSTHILLLKVTVHQPGGWSPTSPSTKKRRVDLTLQLEAVLKGQTQEQPDSLIQIQVDQYAPQTPRIVPVPGVWSQVPITSGSQIVAFCQSRREVAVAAEMLPSSTCHQLLTAADALDDVRLALRAEDQGLTLPALLQQASAIADTLGIVFARYLWARYGPSALEDADNYDALLSFICQPDLAYIARSTLLDAVYSRLMASADLPPERTQHLAAALFELISIRKAENLHDNIIEVFLPNLLGLVEGLDTADTTQVFQDAPIQRQQAASSLNQYQGRASTERLLEWLQ